MEIKNVELFSQTASIRQKQDKAADTAVSFMDYMKTRVQTQTPSAASETELAAPGMFDVSGIEAIGARARIRQDTGGDVTDFLELIDRKPFLLEGMSLDGINDTAAVKPPTETELQSLRENFDTDNLTPRGQLELFGELARIRALSKSDIQKTQMSVSPGKDDLMAYLSKEPGFTDVSAIDEAKPKERLEAMIENERFVYEHIQNRYGKRCESVSELADSHERVLDTLKKI